MSKIDQLVKTIVKAIDEKDRKKTSALDTVATVSRIDGDTAWVKFAGSDSETPVKQTIAVKKGDKVQVRASKGSAWITGNITSPPTDNTLAEEAVKKSDTATKRAKRAEDMSIVADVMYYLASDQDEGVTPEDEGWTQEPQEATVALPYLWCYHEYTRGNGTKFNSDPVIISRYTEGGAGVQSITTYYALGTSTSTAPTSGWATTFSFRSGYYIWRKELISLTDGTTTWSEPVYDGGLTQTCELAFDAAQYIWTQPAASATTNVPSGQYVTEVDKDSYRASPTGGALLLRSAGLYLRYAAQTVAQFLAAGVSLFNSSGNMLASFLSDGARIYEPSDSSYPVAQFLDSGATLGKTTSTNFNTYVDSSGMAFRRGTTTYGGVSRFTEQSGAVGVAFAGGQLSPSGAPDVALYYVGSVGHVYISSGSNSWITMNTTNKKVNISEITAGNIDHGTVTITPSAANTPTSATVSFNKTFTSTPNIIISPRTSVPGKTVTGCGATDATTTGFTAWVCRTNTTATSLDWIAIS